MQVHRTVKGISEIDDDIFKYISHPAPTRADSRGDLVTLRVRKNNYKYNFSAMAPNVCNELGLQKREAVTMSAFKIGFDEDVKNGVLIFFI